MEEKKEHKEHDEIYTGVCALVLLAAIGVLAVAFGAPAAALGFIGMGMTGVSGLIRGSK